MNYSRCDDGMISSSYATSFRVCPRHTTIYAPAFVFAIFKSWSDACKIRTSFIHVFVMFVMNITFLVFIVRRRKWLKFQKNCLWHMCVFHTLPHARACRRFCLILIIGRNISNQFFYSLFVISNIRIFLLLFCASLEVGSRCVVFCCLLPCFPSVFSCARSVGRLPL